MPEHMEILINPSYSSDSVANDDGLNGFGLSDSKDDYPNELCLTMSSTISSPEESAYFNSLHTSYTDVLSRSDSSDRKRLLDTWKMNYHEAAIYLQVSQKFYF